MSNPEETNISVSDTQETYYEGANESFKVETQTMSLNESQDFRLIDSGGDESLVESTKQPQDEEANSQKSVEPMDSPQIPDISEVDNKATNDKKEDDITHERVRENEAIEKIDRNVTSELCESEKKDEPFDEDEIIQGTPPQSYTPCRKVGSVDVTSLKRKARTVDGTPAKIARTASMEDTMDVKKQLEDEDNHQSCDSDDSYQDLFKNIDKNVVIEETQDPTNLEFHQNSLKISTEHATETTDDGKAREHYTEHTDQQRDEECNVEKDENLNVSAKLTDTSVNDSIFDLNFTNENDSQLEGGNLSVETKGDATCTNVVIADEKSGIGTLNKTKSVKDTETMSDENNQIMKSVEKTVDDNDEEILSSQTKSRVSVELIYEGGNLTVGDGESKSKPQIVQIDDDGEKIVLDSSAETYGGHKARPEIVQIDDSHEDNEKNVLDSLGKNSTTQSMDKSSYESKSSTEYSYKSMESMKESSLDSKFTPNKRLVNGSTDSKRCDTDVTLSLDSDILSGFEEQALLPALTDMKKTDSAKSNSFASRIALLKDDNTEVIISDNETSNVEGKNKSDLIYNSTAKTVQVEREIGLYVRFKCLMHVDESTKETVSKELTTVHCDIIEPVMGRQKIEDSQSMLADISDNKDSSPGSVNSNPQLYQLNPRLSMLSSISSSSSASSAASLAIKLATKGTAHLFSAPTGPAKHAKKSFQDVLSTSADKQLLDDSYDRLTREWKNHRLLTTMILQQANIELGNLTTTTTPITATTSTVIDAFANVSNERLDDHHHHHHHHHHLEKNMRSSTPSDQLMNLKMELPDTPKNTNKSKATKRPRSKMTKLNAAQINCENGTNNIPKEPTLRTSATETDTPFRKKSKMENTKEKLLISDTDVLANSSPRSESLADKLIGKNVFAKWSDNTYYPGTVIDRLKGKYKVNFFDGQSKTLIPEFVIPIPKFLRKGLSVSLWGTETNDYDGSFGLIVNVDTSDDDDDDDDDDDNNTYYTVEIDEGEQLRVQMQNICLTADQAQFLKEEMDSRDKSRLPSTPKALGQVTLDNVVDGKRRSKRIGTPLFSTPESRSSVASTSTLTSKTKSEPSGSGMSAKKPKKKSASENDGMSSDSNIESIQVQDIHVLRGVQKETISTPYEHIKGPQSRIKSRPRSKKKMEDPHMIATLGPIPTNSNLFKGMSFVLTCASLETLPRYLDIKSVVSTTETEATETETENETEWVDRPFLRDRLREQILAGSGKIYENFKQIPKDEYKNTMLITNIPSTTEKSILCLSVGIRVCNHKWIIRCCTEEKIVNPAEYALPNGWSFQKKAYVERFETSGNKPLSEVVVIIPHLTYDEQFATFWRQVCENAGAVVLIAENSGAMEKMDFDSNVVVVSNPKCPSWAINIAARLQIPMLSTPWVVQCLIEGKLCPQDHPRYKYSYISN